MNKYVYIQNNKFEYLAGFGLGRTRWVTVERVIGTINRDLMPTLAGFVGHNVTDRKKLEARNSFSRRLGEKSTDAFDIEVTPEQLQEYCDSWANNKYAHKKHGTLGVTPFEKQQSCNKPVRIIKNERALDLLLSDIASGGGFRSVTKHGIKIKGEAYWASELTVGNRVFIRHDPNDAGRIYVFSDDEETFICEAICAKLTGVDPKELIKGIKAEQAANFARDAAPMIKAAKDVKASDVADKILAHHAMNSEGVTAFPKHEIAHTNDKLETADKALDGYVPVKNHGVENNIVELPKAKAEKPDAKRQRLYKKCNGIMADIEADMGLGTFSFTIGNSIYQEISNSVETRFAVLNPLVGRTRKQLLGRGEESKTLTGTFYPYEHGGLAALEAFKAMAGLPIPLMMVSGSGSVFGFWLVASVSDDGSYLSYGNVPQKIEFTVELTRV